MKPATEFQVRRRKGLWGLNWLWGKAAIRVVVQGKERWFRCPLNTPVCVPRKTQEIDLEWWQARKSLRVFVFRGRGGRFKHS